MPLYEFACTSCNNMQDEFYKIADCPTKVKCDKCAAWAVKVIAVGHGGLRCDSITDVPWLESAIQNLPDDAVRIQSRTEHRQYLKEKGYAAIG